MGIKSAAHRAVSYIEGKQVAKEASIKSTEWKLKGYGHTVKLMARRNKNVAAVALAN
jgi:hypothetical protein